MTVSLLTKLHLNRMKEIMMIAMTSVSDDKIVIGDDKYDDNENMKRIGHGKINGMKDKSCIGNTSQIVSL